MQNKKHVQHGEVGIFEIKELPPGAKLASVEQTEDYWVIAPSETSGNSHVLEKKEGIELYERDGILYMKNVVPANVSCLHQARHDTITLEPGIWEVDKAKEWDYEKEEVRNVVD